MANQCFATGRQTKDQKDPGIRPTQRSTHSGIPKLAGTSRGGYLDRCVSDRSTPQLRYSLYAPLVDTRSLKPFPSDHINVLSTLLEIVVSDHQRSEHAFGYSAERSLRISVSA
jgi:hypothetical protein